MDLALGDDRALLVNGQTVMRADLCWVIALRSMVLVGAAADVVSASDITVIGIAARQAGGDKC